MTNVFCEIPYNSCKTVAKDTHNSNVPYENELMYKTTKYIKRYDSCVTKILSFRHLK